MGTKTHGLAVGQINKAMTMYLRRRATFSAGYQQPPPGETGGGHNFQCELTVGGDIDPRTGMVINIKDVDAVLKAHVLATLDGKLLDRDVPAFQSVPPTLANIVQYIWEECKDVLPAGSTLARVCVRATPTLHAEISTIHPLKGSNTPMLTVTRAYDFSASHRLHSEHLTDTENNEIFGKCNWPNGHGHNYGVEVTIAGDINPSSGLLAPWQALDRVMQEEVLTPYDHRHLNMDTPEFASLNPTSENLTRVIWDKIAPRLSPELLGGARLYKVVVRETERNYFEYYGEQPE